jgi:hypothetical protein
MRLLPLLLLVPTLCLAQTPAEVQFGPKVTTATVGPSPEQTLIADLYVQLVIAQKQLATVQGAMGQLQKDLTAAQAKCP